MMIDIALNLSSGQFQSDRGAVMARARQAGVNQYLLLASDAQESDVVTRLAACYPGCYATAGCHPHHANEFEDGDLDAIENFCAGSQVVAVGECGLDYNRNYSDPAIQRRVFEQQLELAARLRLPVLLHERDAHDDFVNILETWLPHLPHAVLHCFTGSALNLERYLAMGLYIGITGWVCDERRGLELRELVTQIPTERLFLETDAPYLLPRDLSPKPKSRRNEPCYLPHIYQTVAMLRGESIQDLIIQIKNNFRQVFLG